MIGRGLPVWYGDGPQPGEEAMRLQDKVAMVTGASKGLGKEMARALAEAGADLVIGARTEADLLAAADEIGSATTRSVMPCVLDVADRDSVEACVAQAMERFGRIDVLVNNAGVNVRSPLAEIKDEDQPGGEHPSMDRSSLLAVAEEKVRYRLASYDREKDSTSEADATRPAGKGDDLT